MSENFLQIKLPCGECLVQAICKDKSGKGLKLNKSTGYCLALPDWDMSKKNYQKGVFECWANFGWQLIQSISKKENSERINVPPQFLDTFVDILSALQWMINCTSWHEGKLHQFDKMEIKTKLKYITRWLDNQESKP